MGDLPHSASLRWARYSEPGSGYHVTKCRDRQCLLSLSDPRVAQIIVDSIDWHRRQCHAHLLAFVVMPDHVHWLFVLGRGRSLAQVMHGFSSVTWRRIAASHGQAVGKVWQAEYYDHRLRPEEMAWATVGYVHDNPVRRGLCANAEDWPWSSGNALFRGWIAAEHLGQ